MKCWLLNDRWLPNLQVPGRKWPNNGINPEFAREGGKEKLRTSVRRVILAEVGTE
jgi:hypothetical protein